MSSIFLIGNVYPVLPTSRMAGMGNVVFGSQRLPTDPLFYANLTLENVIVGSTYRVSRLSDMTTKASGVATDSTIILNIPAFENPAILFVSVRDASNLSAAYQPYEVTVIMTIYGASVYVEQKLD